MMFVPFVSRGQTLGVIGLGTPPSESMSPCVRFEIMKFADTQRGQSPFEFGLK